MAGTPQLALLLGLDKKSIEELLRQSILEAADIVVEEFKGVLDQLNNDSANDVFENYSVVLEVEPYTVKKKYLGTLDLVRCMIYVEGPTTDLNVFDILDSGRKSLPFRPYPMSPYPMWSISAARERQITRPGEKRRSRRTGRFVLSSPPSKLRGLRPERLRYELSGKMKENATYSPSLFVRGPIARVPPNNLYKRIFNNAKKKLRARGYKYLNLLIVEGRRS